MIRVAIAQQQAITRETLREAFLRVENHHVVGEAGSARDALALIEREKPDVLVLDLALFTQADYEQLAKIVQREEAPAAEDVNPASVLTPRELQVMELLGRGLTNREIAEHLTIGLKTVDTHRGHVLKKLRLRNNAELTRFAVKHGYVAL